MTGVLTAAIVFGSIVAIVAIIFTFILSVLRLKGGGSVRQGEPLNADETRLIQELHQGLAKMEKRVEALETILMDREARQEKEGKHR
ncbi:MAG: hypothetical protein Kow0099_05500 [Candidatus Abyssubacteria bacterium]